MFKIKRSILKLVRSSSLYDDLTSFYEHSFFARDDFILPGMVGLDLLVHMVNFFFL